MALINISTYASIPHDRLNFSYNPDVLKIFKTDGEPIMNTNIYEYVTEPPTVKNLNTTDSEVPQWKKILNKSFSTVMAIAVFTLMFGMGCHVNLREIIGNLWPPLPIIIGMCGQFILLPALAYGMAVLFNMEPYTALGCLIVSCSPGGAMSNFFTYWVHGDVALSLVMTTCSTILSFGTMPLNLWIYSPKIIGDDSDNIVIPYKNIIITLGFIVGPVFIGMIIRHWNAKIANKITQILSIIGYLLVLFNMTCIIILNWDTLISASWYIHGSAILLPFSGLSFAYIAAYISGRSHRVCRTIGIETASQNMPVAMGIIVFSFPELELRTKLLLYPTLYAVYMICEICISAALYRWYYYHSKKTIASLPNIDMTSFNR